MYPVGSCYFSTVATSPATVIGGTWSAMTGGMLGLAGSTGVAGAASNGGSRKISGSQLPTSELIFRSTPGDNNVVLRANGAFSKELVTWSGAHGMLLNDTIDPAYQEHISMGGVRIIFLHIPLFMVGEEQRSKVGGC